MAKLTFKDLGSLANLADKLPDAPTEVTAAEELRNRVEKLTSTDGQFADEQVGVETVSFNQKDVEAGAFFIQVLGPKRAVQILANELPGQRAYGRERAQEAIKSAIARVLDQKPRREADPLWVEYNRLPLHSGRAADFDEAIAAVHEAVVSGASARWMEEQKRLKAQVENIRYPDPPEYGNGYGKMEEYAAILSEWSLDYSEAQLRAMNFDAYEIARRWAERERGAIQEKEEALKKAALEKFEATGDFEALKDTFESYATYRAAENKKWAWVLARQGKISPGYIDFPPSSEWLSEQTDVDWLIDAIRKIRQELRPPFREQLLLALPYTPDENHVVVHGQYVIDAEGLIIPLKNDTKSTALYSNKPDPKGWVAVRGSQYDTEVNLYGPKNYEALQEALKCSRGTTDVRPWLKHFGRHPEKGFGRFYFAASYGKSRDSMFISVDDRLAKRLEMIQNLPDKKDADYPDNIFYLPAEFAKKENGGHFRFSPEGKSTSIVYVSSHERIQMARRSAGRTVHHRNTGTAYAWTLSAHTTKHDVTTVVALIGEGKELHLDTGMAYKNEGGELIEIPGGAMTPAESKSIS